MSFCDDFGWGPINPSNDDFTPCFETVLLFCSPSAFMILTGIFKIIRLRAVKRDGTSKKIRSNLRFVSHLALMFLPLVLLFLFALKIDSLGTLYHYLTLMFIFHSSAWMISVVVTLLENSRHLINSLFPRVFWCAQLLVNLKRLESLILKIRDNNSSFNMEHYWGNIEIWFLFVELVFNSIMGYFAIWPVQVTTENTFSENFLKAQQKVSEDINRTEDDEEHLWQKWLSLSHYEPPSHIRTSSSISSNHSSNAEDNSYFIEQSDSYGVKDFSKLILSNDDDDVMRFCLLLRNLQVSIPSWLEVTSDSKKVVKYGIRLRFGESFCAFQMLTPLNVSPGGSFTFWRRFSEFHKTNEQIINTLEELCKFCQNTKKRKDNSDFQLPKFPPKSIFPNLENRRLLLRKYLSDLFNLLNSFGKRFCQPSSSANSDITMCRKKLLIVIKAVQSFMRPSKDKPEEYYEDEKVDQLKDEPTFSESNATSGDPEHKDLYLKYSWRIININVVGWLKWMDELEMKIIYTFTISINTSEGSWALHKTFEQLEMLGKMLSSKFLSVSFPELPRSKWAKRIDTFSRKTNEVLKEEGDFLWDMKKEIEVYLQKIVNTNEFHTNELYEFFNNPKYYRKNHYNEMYDNISFPMKVQGKKQSHFESGPKSLSFVDDYNMAKELISNSITGQNRRLLKKSEPKKKSEEWDKALLLNIDKLSLKVLSYSKTVKDGYTICNKEIDELGMEAKNYNQKIDNFISNDDDFYEDEDIGIGVGFNSFNTQKNSLSIRNLTFNQSPLSAHVGSLNPLAFQMGLNDHSDCDSYHRFEVQIVHWETIEDLNIRPFIIYTIEIREYYSLNEFIEWQIKRRFKRFEKLQKQLKQTLPDVQLPELPPKSLSSNRDVQFIQERIKGLERYMQQLINIGEFQCDKLFEFFELNNPGRNITMGKESSTKLPVSL